MNLSSPWLLRHRTIRGFWQVFLQAASFPFFLFGYFIPKNPEIWIFANTFGFKDNARYLYEYVQEFHPEITAVWIAGPNEVERTHDRHYSCLSCKGLWVQYRAGIAFVSTGHGDFARCTLAGKKIVQLWHGIPIKRILLDSPESLPFAPGSGSGVVRILSLAILRKKISQYTVVIASSDVVQQRLCSAFGLPEERVAITGYPRHDVIWQHSNTVNKRILYAPTWRSDMKRALMIVCSLCNTEFVSKIEEMGYELWVSIHPLNHEIIDGLDPGVRDSINFVGNEDVNLILAGSEIVITDYSSIALDFALLDRQVIFFVPDAQEYLADRGVYEEFESLLREKGVEDVNGVLGLMKEEQGLFDSAIKEVCFKYQDSGARERIVRLCRRLS